MCIYRQVKSTALAIHSFASSSYSGESKPKEKWLVLGHTSLLPLFSPPILALARWQSRAFDSETTQASCTANQLRNPRKVIHPPFARFLFTHLFVYLFYVWLLWVFVATHRLSLVAASQGYSLVAVHGLLIAVASRCRAQAVRCGFSSCGRRA